MNQRILCFTWNANKASLCERYYTDTNGQYSGELIRKSFFKIINGGDCYNPMFFEAIKDRIITHSPDIVTIVTEHESVSETYFHSDFLPHNMKPLGYILLIRDKEAEDSLIIQSYALRMSIYIKDNDMLTKAYYADTLITSEKCESIVPIALGLYVHSIYSCSNA